MRAEEPTQLWSSVRIRMKLGELVATRALPVAASHIKAAAMPKVEAGKLLRDRCFDFIVRYLSWMLRFLVERQNSLFNF
jgi:hypothetical protein